MTGRGMGSCGRSYGPGRFFGWGRGWKQKGWGFVGFSKEEEKELLQDEAKSLEAELQEIKTRITDLDK
jgi:hypothetical protein